MRVVFFTVSRFCLIGVRCGFFSVRKEMRTPWGKQPELNTRGFQKRWKGGREWHALSPLWDQTTLGVHKVRDSSLGVLPLYFIFLQSFSSCSFCVSRHPVQAGRTLFHKTSDTMPLAPRLNRRVDPLIDVDIWFMRRVCGAKRVIRQRSSQTPILFSTSHSVTESIEKKKHIYRGDALRHYHGQCTVIPQYFVVGWCVAPPNATLAWGNDPSSFTNSCWRVSSYIAIFILRRSR